MTWSDVPACPYPYQDGVAKIYDPFTGILFYKDSRGCPENPGNLASLKLTPQKP